MLRVVVVGYGEMFTNLIAGSLDANCEVVGVFRKESLKYPYWYKKLKDVVNPTLEYNYIKSYNINEIHANSVNSEGFRKELMSLSPDIVLVGSWGEKIEKKTFDIAKIATINAHPSLLPKYRGPNPYFWVIKNQEKTSGITFHLVDEGLDTGAILAQEEIKVFPSDTGLTLKQRTVLTARGVICDLLNALSEDIIIPLQQNPSKASYYSHPDGLELDFKKTAEENFALIKAAYPWNSAYFYHDTTPFIPNPNKVLIEENTTNYSESGTIVGCDIKTKMISVLCGNKKVLKMIDVNLYKKFDRPFVKNYIAREINVGQVLF